MGGWAKRVYFLFFISGAKNFAGSEPRKAGRANTETAAAIPFPLKPLFLAAAADAVNFYEFLIK